MDLLNQLRTALESVGNGEMALSQVEITRAMDIKSTAGQHPGLKALSDFEYAQYALCTTDESQEQVLWRMQAMQAFREEYHVHDTAEEGRRVIGQLTEQHPGFLLAILYLETDQSYISILDLESFVSSHMNNAAQFRTFIVALYYILQCNQNHFKAIRTGTSVMAECLGVDSDTFDGDFLTTTMQELYLPYPQRNKVPCPVETTFASQYQKGAPRWVSDSGTGRLQDRLIL